MQERRLSQAKERPNGPSRSQFATEFWFSKTAFFARIKCSEWNPEHNTQQTVFRRKEKHKYISKLCGEIQQKK